MSREIKFRLMVERDPNVWIKNEYELRELIEMDGLGFLDGNEIIEQCTGLSDKYGKEIYKGDIVEYDWYIRSGKPAYRVKGQVVFDDMGARVGNDRIRNCTNVVVIGNIHENPELLNDERPMEE